MGVERERDEGVEMNIEGLIWAAIIKGIVGAIFYIWVSRWTGKTWAALIVFLLFTGIPWLGLMYSGKELLEQLGDLAIWSIDSGVALVSGAIFIFFYELFTGGSRRERYV